MSMRKRFLKSVFKPLGSPSERIFVASAFAVSSLACATLSVTARAADVYIEPAISVAVGHDDNVRLDPVNADSQSRVKVVAQAEVGSRTASRDAIFNAAAHLNRYSDSELDRTDWFFDFDLLRHSQRDEFGLLTGYRRASTLTTEIEDTGRVQVDRLREDWSIAPFWTHKLTEATDTTLRYEFEDVAFEDGAQVGLIDYRNHSVDVSVTHRLNVSTNLIGSIDYQRFESEDTTDSDSVGLLIGLERIFSPRFQAGLSLGAESTDIEFFVADGTRENRSDSMAIFTTNATWTLENGSFLIEGSRREEPSAQGSLSNLEQVQATWQQALTPVYELILGVGASQREFAPVGSQAAEDRKYYNAEARIVWRGRPRWQIDFAYQYRRQEFDDPQGGVTGDASNRADSSAVWLTAGYTWTRIGLFR